MTISEKYPDSYLERVNHPEFRKASLLVWQARQALERMGMSETEAKSWVMTWGSGAGDGIV